ncbi:hypothetical protein ABPG77_001534 [Micractinium sp. CCAP 211/92]
MQASPPAPLAAGYALSTGFQAATGGTASTAVTSRSASGSQGAAIVTGSQGRSIGGGQAGSLSAAGTFATPHTAGAGGLTTAGVTGRGSAYGYGVEAVARGDNTGPLIPTLGGRVGQGALTVGQSQATGQAARASVGGLSTVTPAGTGAESVTAASTTTAGTFSDVIAGAGLPRTVAGGIFSGAYAASSSAAVDSAATSSGYGYGIGQSALTVVTERATAGTGAAPPAPARKANIFKHHLFFKG